MKAEYAISWIARLYAKWFCMPTQNARFCYTLGFSSLYIACVDFKLMSFRCNGAKQTKKK